MLFAIELRRHQEEVADPAAKPDDDIFAGDFVLFLDGITAAVVPENSNIACLRINDPEKAYSGSHPLVYLDFYFVVKIIGRDYLHSHVGHDRDVTPFKSLLCRQPV